MRCPIWKDLNQPVDDEHQTHFSKADIARFTKWSKWLNEMEAGGSGDVCFATRRGIGRKDAEKESGRGGSGGGGFG